MAGDRKPILTRHPRHRPPAGFRTCRPADVHQSFVVTSLRDQVDDRLSAGRVRQKPSADGDERVPIAGLPGGGAVVARREAPGSGVPVDDSVIGGVPGVGVPGSPRVGRDSVVPHGDAEGGRP